MKTPSCDCAKNQYIKKYANNPKLGKLKDEFQVCYNSDSRVVIEALGNHGTIKLPPNYCPNCGKPSVIV
jgi:hypothetical protein